MPLLPLASNGDQIYFCIHVDDFTIAASNPDLISDLCDTLKERYTITGSDNLESFLVIHIVKEDERLDLSQPGHIAKCAATAGIDLSSKPCYIPMAPSFNDADQHQSPPAVKKQYATLLGMLIYILRTRPDVAYAVNRLVTRSSAHSQRHRMSSPGRQLFLHHIAPRTGEQLTRPQSTPSNRKTIRLLRCRLPHTCRLQISLRNQVHSRRKHGRLPRQEPKTKKNMVTLSSTEAEVYAATKCTKDIIYFRDILKELGYEQLQPTTLYMDNKNAII